MESCDPDNRIQPATDDENAPPASVFQDIRSTSTSDQSPTSRGFSLNITLRWRPFTFVIDVTPLSQASSPSRYMP